MCVEQQQQQQCSKCSAASLLPSPPGAGSHRAPCPKRCMDRRQTEPTRSQPLTFILTTEPSRGRLDAETRGEEEPGEPSSLLLAVVAEPMGGASLPIVAVSNSRLTSGARVLKAREGRGRPGKDTSTPKNKRPTRFSTGCSLGLRGPTTTDDTNGLLKTK